MGKTSRSAVIFFGVMAVLWVIRILFLMADWEGYASFSFVLRILCAIFWIAAFGVILKRHLSEKGKPADEN